MSKGTVIARINDADLQANLQKTRALLQVARLSQGRLETLLKVQGVNQADYDLAVSQVRSNQADAAYTQALLSKTVIRAPFTGVLGLRQVSPGAYVTPATSIATLQADTKLKVDFTLPEANGGRGAAWLGGAGAAGWPPAPPLPRPRLSPRKAR